MVSASLYLPYSQYLQVLLETEFSFLLISSWFRTPVGTLSSLFDPKYPIAALTYAVYSSDVYQTEPNNVRFEEQLFMFGSVRFRRGVI